MKWRPRTVEEIAEMICGDRELGPFKYRSSSYLTRFFRDVDTDYVHRGETRAVWVAEVLTEILNEPHSNAQSPPATFLNVIRSLMDPADVTGGDTPEREAAMSRLNVTLNREGFEAFYGEDKICHLRHVATNAVVIPVLNPHRPFSKAETERRDALAKFLDTSSEDQLLEDVLLPLFRQLGFHRISLAGHKDKSLEYGKDLWMRYVLPTQHVLYFGLQAKRDKLDAAGVSKSGHANVAEIVNQVQMMLGHEIFDPEFSRRVLVDHAFIVAGGEITKAARNWIGNKFDSLRRSQLLFMDRDDILNLYVVTNMPLPAGAVKSGFGDLDDDIPF